MPNKTRYNNKYQVDSILVFGHWNSLQVIFVFISYKLESLGLPKRLESLYPIQLIK